MTDGGAADRPRVRLDREGAVATVTLDRPDALNALDMRMNEELAAVLARLESDDAVRAVVLTGTGEAFMAGGDIRMFAALLDEPGEAPQAFIERLIHSVHQGIVIPLRRMGKPVVASVRGPCAGFGLSLVAACDLAVAADDAMFTLAYSHIGTSPDGGATYHLPRLVGQKKAMEIALLGDRFGAAEAERLGLVNQVVPVAELEERTRALAHRLASGPTRAYAATKRLINASSGRSLESQLQAEAEAFTACSRTADFAEGVSAFLAKHPPAFHNG